jgi:hypothetical protein
MKVVLDMGSTVRTNVGLAITDYTDGLEGEVMWGSFGDVNP